MDGWATFWGWFLIAVLGVFGLLSIGVAIGGFFDVKALFSSIDRRHEKD